MHILHATAHSKPSNKHIIVSDSVFEKQVGGSHYKTKIQHVEFCQVNKVPWCEAAAIKYVVRHRRKNGKEDIEKAIHYVEFVIAIDYARDESRPEAPGSHYSIQEFISENGIPELEAEIITLIYCHSTNGEPGLHKAIKLLKKLLKDYETLALLD